MVGARPWLVLATLNGMIAVAAGAFGWHSLEVTDSDMRDVFLTGVDYQMWHALALIASRGRPNLSPKEFPVGIPL